MKPSKRILSSLLLLCGVLSLHAAQETNYLTNEPISIPLHFYEFNSEKRLAIYVGVNGGAPLPYLFDTGSSVLEAIIGNKPYKPNSPVRGVKNISSNFGYEYGDGNGFSGTLVQTTVSLYAQLTDSIPLITFTNAANSTKGIIVNAVSQHWTKSTNNYDNSTTNYVMLDKGFWAALTNNINNSTNGWPTTGWPIEGHIVGTFGASPFIGSNAYVFPNYPTNTNGRIKLKNLPKGIIYGSVIGQVTTNGYIVDATSNSPTLTIGYNNAEFTKFSNTILFDANKATDKAAQKFPASGTATIGYAGGNELTLDSLSLYGSNNYFNTPSYLELWRSPEGILLDSGTADFNVKINDSYNSYALSFLDPKGNIFSNNIFAGYKDGLQIFSILTSGGQGPLENNVATKTDTIGIGIFMQNQILFDLANTQIGFIPVLPHYDHIVLVILENHGYQELASNNLPFINGVIRAGGADIVQSYSLQHPSQPNYYWLFSGANQGIVSDDYPANLFTSDNLYTELTTLPGADTNKIFRGFIDGYPGAANLTNGEYATAGNLGGNTNNTDEITYAHRHCPWLGFSNVPTNATADFATFNTIGYSNLPKVSIVIPALENDMHDYAANPNTNGGPASSWTNTSLPAVSDTNTSLTAMQHADAWLANNLGPYAQWALSNNSLLIITTDEDSTADWVTPPNSQENVYGLTAPTASFSSTTNAVPASAQTGPNQITTLFYGANVIPGDYPENNGITHVNVLRTIESLCGSTNVVGAQSGAVTNIDEAPITDIFTH